MIYQQELLARELYADLADRFSTQEPSCDVSINGAGVHWHCTVRRQDRSCHVSTYEPPAPAYWIGFKQGDHYIAGGWTASLDDIQATVRLWIEGSDRATLYEQFAFVDRNSRAIIALRAALLQSWPDLASLIRLQPEGYGRDVLLIASASERACEVECSGYKDPPNAAFLWDDTKLFQFPVASADDLGAVLWRWLLDRAMPSALEREFPWIAVGRLAHYYETGHGIEGEFILSWDRLEDRYREAVRKNPSPEALALLADALRQAGGDPACLEPRIAPAAVAFLAALRQAGYDSSLRAGVSVWTCMLSRSRRHGLRADQPEIHFDFHGQSMDVSAWLGDEVKLNDVPIELTPEIAALLDRLAAHEID